MLLYLLPDYLSVHDHWFGYGHLRLCFQRVAVLGSLQALANLIAFVGYRYEVSTVQ